MKVGRKEYFDLPPIPIPGLVISRSFNVPTTRHGRLRRLRFEFNSPAASKLPPEGAVEDGRKKSVKFCRGGHLETLQSVYFGSQPIQS